MSWWTDFRDSIEGGASKVGKIGLAATGAGLGGVAGLYGASKLAGGGGPNGEGGYDPNGAYAGMPALPTDVTSGVSRDTSGLDAFSKEAMRTGPSAWAGLARTQNKQNATDAYNRGSAQTASQGQASRDQLAMTGGLTGGAAERSAMDTSKNMLSMGQDIGRQENQNDLQIGINDEQNRIGELSSLPGMQLQGSQFDLSKAQGQNQFNATNYGTQAGIWAAGKQASMEDPRNPQSPNYDDGKRWFNPFSW